MKICQAGDAMILEKVATSFKGVEKGIAFPTTLSNGSCVAYQSAAADEGADAVLIEDELVRIDLGVQIDGYVSVVAHTIQVTADGAVKADSREGQILAAAHQVLATASRQLHPGTDFYQITEVIEKAAAHFGFNTVEGVLSHQMKRYIIDGVKCIPQKNVSEHKVHSYDVQPSTVFALDVVLTTGKGKLKERDAKAGIYKISLDSSYAPKLTAAQEVMKEVEEKFQIFPFAIRNLENKKARLGVSELVKHGAVARYAPIYEKDGELIAHFKMTILVTNKKIERVTGIELQKGCPAPAPYTDAALLAANTRKFAFDAPKAAAATEAQ
jgi:curved DNA binding protein